MRRTVISGLLVIAVAVLGPAHAGLYKYTDDEGVMHIVTSIDDWIWWPIDLASAFQAQGPVSATPSNESTRLGAPYDSSLKLSFNPPLL